MSEKQLTFNQVKKDNKKYKEKKRIEFDNGEFYLDIYPNFEPLKIKEMMKDASETFAFAEENNINITDSIVLDFINCFIIKHFTSIPHPTDKNKLIQGFIDMINSDYYVQILNAFDVESVNKVFDSIFKGLELTGQFENKKNDLNKSIQDETVEE